MHQKINPIDLWVPKEDIVVDRGRITEQFTTISGYQIEDPGDMFSRLDTRYAGTSSIITRMDIVGRVNNWTRGGQSDYCYNCQACPIADHAAAHVCPVTGIQVHAVSGTPVQPVWLGGKIIGTVFEDDDARYCQLHDLHPNNKQASPLDQSYELFQLFEAGLKQAGMSFAHVVRTWVYGDNLSEWRADLDTAQDHFFRECHAYDNPMPANTTVSGRNLHGTKITGNVLAIQSKATDNISVVAIDCPMHGQSQESGAGYSHAIEVDTPSHRRLYTSAIASLDGSGHVVCPNSLDEQIDDVMNAASILLKSRQMDWRNVTRAVAHLQDKHVALPLAAYCITNDIPELPIAIALNTSQHKGACFELELDAICLQNKAAPTSIDLDATSTYLDETTPDLLT